MLRKITFILLCLSPVFLAKAQESNYSTTLQGGKASLLSGAVVGGVFDNTAFYYNPGAVGFLGEATISINTSSVGWNLFGARNSFGDELGFGQSQGQFVPYMIGGTVPIKINQVPNLVLGYSFFTKSTFEQSFEVRQESILDANPLLDGDEYYSTNYKSYTALSDKWLGLTASYKLSEHWGFGLSSFFTFTNYDKSFSTQASVIPLGIEPNGYASTYHGANRIEIVDNGVIFKIGLAYHQSVSKFGLSITMPRVNFDIITSRLSQDVRLENIPDFENGGGNIIGSIIDQNSVSTNEVELKTPYSAAFGYAWQPRDTRFYGLTVEYFHSIDAYQVMAAGEGYSWSVSDQVIFQQSELLYMRENQSVFNVSFGLIEEIREGFQMIIGMRTNRSFLKEERAGLNESGNMAIHDSSTDLYHLSFGVNGYSKAIGLNLTIGTDMAFGYRTNAEELVNWTDPKMISSNARIPLTGDLQSNATYLNGHLMFIVGAQYQFGQK